MPKQSLNGILFFLSLSAVTHPPLQSGRQERVHEGPVWHEHKAWDGCCWTGVGMRRGIAQGSARCMGTCQCEKWQGSERVWRNVWGAQWGLEMVCRSVQVTGVVQRVQRVWGRVCRWGRLTLAICDPQGMWQIAIMWPQDDAAGLNASQLPSTRIVILWTQGCWDSQDSEPVVTTIHSGLTSCWMNGNKLMAISISFTCFTEICFHFS